MMDFSAETNAAQVAEELTEATKGLPAALENIKKAVGQSIADRLPSNMHWQDGTGALEGSFMFDGNEVGSDLPYARRRELGFFGADSLGRNYHDQGAFYMRETIDEAETQADAEAAFQSEMAGLFG